MSKSFGCLYEFGPFRLDPAERLLLCDGEPVALTPKAFETLLVLVQHSGHVVEKDELIRRVWPDAVVEESNLAHHISGLRRALSEGGNGHPYIETVPKLGYRFASGVRELQDGGADLILERHTRARIVIEEKDEGTESRAGGGEREKEEEQVLSTALSRPDSLPYLGGLSLVGWIDSGAPLPLGWAPVEAVRRPHGGEIYRGAPFQDFGQRGR